MTKNIRGVETFYQHIGKKGKFLVLLHGWGCNWEIWAPVIPELSKKYQLIIPDLPSLGKSGTPHEIWDTPQFAKWLRTFTEEIVGEETFFLAGHSFGGKIATTLTAQGFDKIEKLIIIDASGLPDDLDTSKQLQESILSLIPAFLKESIPESLKIRLAKMTGSSIDYRNANSYQRKVLKKIFKEDLEQELKHIKTPTVIIWGKNDLDTPVHQGKRFYQLIQGSQLEIFEESGHFPFIDESVKFAEVVTAFLS